MGGTFDPVHIGHLVTAEVARHEFGLEKVYFVPSGKPPHKQTRPVTDAEHRYLMTLLATAANPHFYLSREEIDRSGYSYTVDTVEYFLQAEGPCEVFFITGADAIRDMHTWHRYRDLLGLAQIVAATRPGFSLKTYINSEHFSQHELDHIHLLEVPSLAISSTDIRRRVRDGRPIKYLVLESVENYIHKFGLYL